MADSNLNNWLFQQRDAFAAFFDVDGSREGFESLVRMIDTIPVTFLECGTLCHALTDEWHSEPSHVRYMVFRDDELGEVWDVAVAAPRDDGTFIVNGRRHFVPFGRLLPIQEYRRVDTSLRDLWERRIFGAAGPQFVRVLNRLEGGGSCTLAELKAVVLSIPSIVSKEQLKPRVTKAIRDIEDDLNAPISLESLTDLGTSRLCELIRSGAWKELFANRSKNRPFDEGFTLAELVSRPIESHITELARQWRVPSDAFGAIQRLSPASQVLALYLSAILRPASATATVSTRWRPDPLLVEAEDGPWRTPAILPQVRTFNLLESHQNRYVGVLAAERTNIEERRSWNDEVDCFHTPESGTIGLTRRLALGSFVTQDRQIEQRKLAELDETAPPTVGAISGCIPFLRNNDPRRVLMGCNMLVQSVKVEMAEAPLVRTEVETSLCEAIPSMFVAHGVNLRTAFMLWHGYNYEDAVVVSAGAAHKLGIKELRKVSVGVKSYLDFDLHASGSFEQGIRRVRSFVRKGDQLIRLRCNLERLDRPLDKQPDRPLHERMRPGVDERGASVGFPHFSLNSPCTGTVHSATLVPLFNQPDNPGSRRFRARVDFTIEVKRPLQIGDKLCNRYGNKGVVSRIVADDDMPQWRGHPLEILFNPIGVLNRGNYGQLYEAAYGAYLGNHSVPEVSLAQFEATPLKLLPTVCAGAGLEADGTDSVIVRNGNDELEYRCVVGMNYILRLAHHAEEKLTVHTTGKYSRRTGQPPQGHGQKYGEMELWCLQAHWVEEILSELCHDGIGLNSEDATESESPENGTEPAGEATLVAEKPCPREPVAVLAEYLRALGLGLEEGNEGWSIHRSGSGELGIEVFDNSFNCEGDDACNPQKSGAPVKLRSADQRLNSPAFEREVTPEGGLYIDLGSSFRVECGRSYVVRTNDGKVARTKDGEKLKRRFIFEGERLPVLPLSLRWSSVPGTVSELSSAYRELIKALWSRTREGARWKPTDEQIERRIRKILEKLLHEIDGKPGIVRRVCASRRLEYSCRMVIVPEPGLSLDEVSLPWNAVRRLYEDVLDADPAIAVHLKANARQLVRDKFHHDLLDRVNAVLVNERVLLNRNPSLTQYSILAFQPRVHFDGQVMKLCPFVTTPFGADFDGDTMTAVRLRRKESIQQAERLLPSRNLRSLVHGDLVFPLTKEFLLGFALAVANDKAFASLNNSLRAAGLPEMGKRDIENAGDAFAEYVSAHVAPEGVHSARVNRFYSIIQDAALGHVMQFLQEQSSLGPAATIAQAWSPYLKSRSAKDLVTTTDAHLPTGIELEALRKFADERIGMMMLAESQKGLLGGLIRQFYYRIKAEPGSDEFRRILAACQWLTAEAMQKALSPKSTAKPLTKQAFVRQLKQIRDSGEDSGGLAATLGVDAELLVKCVARIPSLDSPIAARLTLLAAPAKFLAQCADSSLEVTRDALMG